MMDEQQAVPVLAGVYLARAAAFVTVMEHLARVDTTGRDTLLGRGTNPGLVRELYPNDMHTVVQRLHHRAKAWPKKIHRDDEHHVYRANLRTFEVALNNLLMFYPGAWTTMAEVGNRADEYNLTYMRDVMNIIFAAHEIATGNNRLAWTLGDLFDMCYSAALYPGQAQQAWAMPESQGQEPLAGLGFEATLAAFFTAGQDIF